MAQTLHWPRHHAVEASAFAISSCICMKISSGASAPPKLFGSRARYSPFSTSAEVTAGVSRRVRSISSASRAIRGFSARARSTRPNAAGRLMALSRPSSRVINYCLNSGPSRAREQGRARSRGGAAEIERLPLLCRETQGDGDRCKAYGEGSGVQPGIAVERVVDVAAGPRSQCHAEAREGGDGAEHRAHDTRAKELAYQHRIKRHHAAIGEAKHDRQCVELAEMSDREIGRDTQRLHQQAADQHRLGAEAIGHRAEQETSAKPGKSGEAVDGDRGQRRDAARSEEHT